MDRNRQGQVIIALKERLLLDSRGLDLKAWYNDDPLFQIHDRSPTEAG